MTTHFQILPLSDILNLPFSDTHLAEIILYRLGSYGTVHVDWQTGFLSSVDDQGYSVGSILPDRGTDSIQHGRMEIHFNVQVRMVT